jgi:hypothetical protein
MTSLALWRALLLVLATCCILPGCGSGDDERQERVGVGPSPGPSPGLGGSRTLAIAPSIQQTQVWCWATAAEMLFRYYGLPNANPFGNYQCGIVAAWFGGQCFQNCGLCQFAVGPMSNMQQVITRYGTFLTLNGIPSRSLNATLLFRGLSAPEVKNEIDAGRPIVVGIAPGGGFALPNASQHIAVVIGYDYSRGVEEVIVNDPYPFDLIPAPNPYLVAGGSRFGVGQFRIQIAALTIGLGWANTIYQIQ